jgi:ABC-type sulfate transport system substrate-binding protein
VKGIISCSPLVIVVQLDNPLGIEDCPIWPAHPDPHASGGAKQALVAEYGSALLDVGSGDRKTAQEQTPDVQANVVATPPSAWNTLRGVVFGAGDALATYEEVKTKGGTRTSQNSRLRYAASR